MSLLLSDEEIQAVIGESFPNDYSVVSLATQAQLKKVVDYMGANGGLHINEFNNKHFEMDWNVWQALKKEAGIDRG